MLVRRTSIPISCALALAVALGSAPALADGAKPTKQQIEEAMPHFSKGVELYDENDFAGALVEFKRAYQLAADYHVFFNIAQAAYQVQNYAGALDAFQRYLNDGGANIAKDRRQFCEKEVVKLKGRVAKVELVVNVPGATVSVDDEEVGTTPLAEPLTVSQGKRKITVSLKDHVPETRTLELSGGDSQRLEFQLKEEEKAPPPPPPVVDTKKKIPWVAWGVTGGIAAGAAVTGVLALVFNADAKSKLGTLGSTADDITGAEGRAHAFALVTDILIGGAILSGGISFILTVTAKSEPVPAPAAAPAARLVIGPGSVGVVGTF